MILVGSFQLRIFYDFQDILCPTCNYAPCTGRSHNNYTTKSICRVFGWVGREALVFPPSQPEKCAREQNSRDTELGRAPSIPKLGREGRHLPAALTATSETPSVQLQEYPAWSCCQGTPQESQIPWRIPDGNHSCPCSGSHSLPGKGLYPKSSCSSMTCTQRFWSPHSPSGIFPD